jgi:hypothetical protein
MMLARDMFSKYRLQRMVGAIQDISVKIFLCGGSIPLAPTRLSPVFRYPLLGVPREK